MTAEEQQLEPETTSDAATSPTLEGESRPLNRAERRAQEHGKKGTTSGTNLPRSGFQNKGGFGGFGGGNTPAKNRLPRTGHK